jgi:hypothetical protein
MQRMRPSPWLPLLPILVFLASWPLPGSERGGDLGDGLKLFIYGIAAPYLWAANPLLWIGSFLLWRGRVLAAWWCGALATALAVASLGVFPELITYPCYWAWALSMAILALAAPAARYFPNSRDKELEELRSEIAELRRRV